MLTSLLISSHLCVSSLTVPFRQCVFSTSSLWQTNRVTVSFRSNHHDLRFFILAFSYHRDLPPSGGYQPIRYKRNLPGKNPSGVAIFGSILAICGYGFYKVAQGNLEQR